MQRGGGAPGLGVVPPREAVAEDYVRAAGRSGLRYADICAFEVELRGHTWAGQIAHASHGASGHAAFGPGARRHLARRRLLGVGGLSPRAADHNIILLNSSHVSIS